MKQERTEKQVNRVNLAQEEITEQQEIQVFSIDYTYQDRQPKTSIFLSDPYIGNPGPPGPPGNDGNVIVYWIAGG